MAPWRAGSWKFSRLTLIATLIFAALSRAGAQFTESPFTVPPGRLIGQVELMSLTLNRHDPGQADKPFSAQAVAATRLTTGLTQALDLQVGIEWFLREEFDLRGRHDPSSGMGTLSLRSKYTFWNDPTLGAAAAVEPYIRIPTRKDGVGSGAVEGGVAVPWAIGKPGGTTFGAMAEWDLVRNDSDTGYDSIWYVAGLLSQPVIGSLSLYAESSLAVSSAKVSDWALTAGGGATWLLALGMRLDCSLHRTFTRGANDWNPVLRLRWEF
ncbi:MAG: transporter [Opitutaceae bacterium]|nr:transporter [Opitutaceae bacterium]